jgi:ArsR family transcriptional regulator
MDDAVTVFKALSDRTRARIVAMLLDQGETCVCILARVLGMPECSVSRHLAVLRAAGMVCARRQRTWMYYRMANPKTRLRKELWKCLRTCSGEDPQVRRDRERVQRLNCGNLERRQR